MWIYSSSPLTERGLGGEVLYTSVLNYSEKVWTRSAVLSSLITLCLDMCSPEKR